MHIPVFERYLGNLKDQPCRLLEVGTFEGRSAIWMADNLTTHPEARVETIDVWPWPTFVENLRKRGEETDKIIVLTGYSSVVLRELPLGAYDFVYIDGCHRAINALEDAVLAFRLTKLGGIIAFDDYPSIDWQTHVPPKPAIDAFLGFYCDEIELLHFGYQVWIKKTVDQLGYRPP